MPLSKVLVGDDDATLRRVLSRELTELGFAVTSAADAKDIETRIATDRPDVVLLDLRLPGVDGHEALARILATVLFTDVVDSSGEVRRRGDLAWSDVNATLDERTRDLVVEFGGEVVKSTGDGALAVFDGAARAVRCGIELVSTAPHLGLAIRVGIHTGEVETIAGDVHGLAVHEAARVLAAAAPGEVLVSEVTRVIAGGAGLAFGDRGNHDLKGIGSRRLFAATRSG